VKPDVTVQIFNIGEQHQIRVEGRIVTFHGFGDCKICLNITSTAIAQMLLEKLKETV
jgi:hypothetical protein